MTIASRGIFAEKRKIGQARCDPIPNSGQRVGHAGTGPETRANNFNDSRANAGGLPSISQGTKVDEVSGADSLSLESFAGSAERRSSEVPFRNPPRCKLLRKRHEAMRTMH